MAEEWVPGGDAHDRIERMEQTGLISKRQAQQLKAGLAGHAGANSRAGETTTRHRVPILVVVGILGFVFLMLILLSGGTPQGVQDVAATLNEPGTVGAMNRVLSISIAVFILVVVPVIILAGSYNSLVNREEAVLTSWSQVESQFQRRADLIPALVETVSRYMQYERDTLTDVTAQRRPNLDRLAEAMDQLVQEQASLAGSSADDERVIENQAALTRFYQETAAVGEGIRGLLAVVEDYPTLASGDQFLELQAQLEGTENRINVARMRFNQAVGDFNSASRRIPGNLAAALGGFKRKAYFRAEDGSDQAEDDLFE